jgi:hypothetical protein
MLIFVAVESMRPPLSDLHRLVRTGDLAKVQLCLFGEYDPKTYKGTSGVNSKDKLGMPALHVAVAVGNLEMVKYLLSADANINARDKDQCSALHIAAAQAHEHIAQCLINNSIQMNLRDKVSTLHLFFFLQTLKSLDQRGKKKPNSKEKNPQLNNNTNQFYLNLCSFLLHFNLVPSHFCWSSSSRGQFVLSKKSHRMGR